MKIINDPRNKTLPSTTLNDIPVGQVFTGTITSPASGRQTTGLFYKLHGRTNILSREGRPVLSADVLVVRLDDHNEPRSAPLWKWCAPVENYQPLEAELIIQKVNA